MANINKRLTKFFGMGGGLGWTSSYVSIFSTQIMIMNVCQKINTMFNSAGLRPSKFR